MDLLRRSYELNQQHKDIDQLQKNQEDKKQVDKQLNPYLLIQVLMFHNQADSINMTLFIKQIKIKVMENNKVLQLTLEELYNIHHIRNKIQSNFLVSTAKQLLLLRHVQQLRPITLQNNPILYFLQALGFKIQSTVCFFLEPKLQEHFNNKLSRCIRILKELNLPKLIITTFLILYHNPEQIKF